jgi:hypothetical protein
MGSRPAYASREALALALDRGLTVRSIEGLDRALYAATDTIEQTLERVFWPWSGTRTFDVPADDTSTSTPAWKLWLAPHDLISLTSLTVGGSVVAGAQARPDNRTDRPAAWLELDRTGSDSFHAGASGSQRRASVLGLWGWWDESRRAGTLSAGADSDDLVIDLTTAPSAGTAAVGVGHLLKINSERMIVEDRAITDTTVNLSADLAATVSNTMPAAVAVASGAAFAAGEIIAVDGEWMLIERIVDNTLYVRRGYASTAVATHANGAGIYAYRRLQVYRAAAGTTAAAHDASDTVTRWVPPPAIEALCIALAQEIAVQEGAAYARTIGDGDNERESRAAGLAGAWKRARAYSRKGGRHYVV